MTNKRAFALARIHHQNYIRVHIHIFYLGTYECTHIHTCADSISLLLPAEQVVLATRYWRHDAYGLYVGVSAGYLLLCLLLCVYISCTDWQKHADRAKERSEVAKLKTKSVYG